MNNFKFTNAGLEYAAKTTTGSTMVFTKGKFGDGNCAGTDTAALSELIHPLGELKISKQTIDGKQVTVQTQFSNVIDGQTLPSFNLREAGLFAKLQVNGIDDAENPETLVAYAYAEGDDRGDYISDTPTEFIINWPFVVSNADNINIITNQTAYALQKDFEVVENTVDNLAENKVETKVVTSLPSMTREYTFDSNTEFTAVERCALSIVSESDEKFLRVTTASNTGNKYALAQLNFADIGQTADTFVIEMDTRMPSSRWYISLVDLSKRPGESYRMSYDTTGVAVSYGTRDGDNYNVNGTDVFSDEFTDK